MNTGGNNWKVFFPHSCMIYQSERKLNELPFRVNLYVSHPGGGWPIVFSRGWSVRLYIHTYICTSRIRFQPVVPLLCNPSISSWAGIKVTFSRCAFWGCDLWLTFDLGTWPLTYIFFSSLYFLCYAAHP